MPEFDYENMRYAMSPLEVIEEISMSKDGLMRARIIEPEIDDFTVLGYDFMWNKDNLAVPNDTERLKVVEFALGDTSLDLTVALILEQESLASFAAFNEQMAALQVARRQAGAERRREREQMMLDQKKELVRMRILQGAELTPDAIELIKREVMVEHPDLHFPDQPE